MAPTTLIEANRLLIPVLEISESAQGRRRFHLQKPATPEGDYGRMPVENAILGQLCTASELETLLLLKVNAPEPNPELFKPLKLATSGSGAGERRSLIFSSGQNHYFGGDALKAQIQNFFRSEPDAACRYGSLFTSNCYEGTARIQGLRFKLVDYTQPEAARFQSGDCHGKCSSALAAALNGSPERPFQFRLAWNRNWDVTESPDAPVSFIAKGTLAVEDDLVGDYDLILDRSSIKGIHKTVLDDFMPLGDYYLPQVVMGNRQNATATPYRNSWQFTACFSPAAIAADLGPITIAKAARLAQIQSDPARLKRLILAEAAERNQGAEGLDGRDQDREGDPDPAMIQILKADVQGILSQSPKVQDYCARFLQRQWQELAVNGGFKHHSALAQPAPQLQSGQVCIPGVADGEEVIVTRSPIPSKDNIRKYINRSVPKLCQYENVIWMHPADAAQFHQGDFDGDQMQWSYAKDLPHIAQEVAWTHEPGDFEAIVQRPKQPYILVDRSGFTFEPATHMQPAPVLSGNLREAAAYGSENKVGIVATLIGRVQGSQPDSEDRSSPEALAAFHQDKKALLTRLMQALQIEVDYGKSAERLEDVEEIGGSTLLAEAKDWADAYPMPFFDFHKDRNVYRTYQMPEGEDLNSALDVLPKLVNAQWEPARLHHTPRHYFQGAVANLPRLKEFERFTRSHELDADAKAIKTQYNEALGDLRKQGLEGQAFRKSIKAIYDAIQADIDARDYSPQELIVFQQKLWVACHSADQPDEFRQACLAWAEGKDTHFGAKRMQLPYHAVENQQWVLSAPFGPEVEAAKAKLDAAPGQYTALISTHGPYVDFVLERPSRRLVSQLLAAYPDHDLQPQYGGRIEAPAKYLAWAQPQQTAGGLGSLAYNLCLPTLVERLRHHCPIQEMQLIGLQYNEHQQTEGFAEGTLLRVGRLPADHPDLRHANQPCLETLDGRAIGTFAQNSRMPMLGTVFQARSIEIEGYTKDGRNAAAVVRVEPGTLRVPQRSSGEFQDPEVAKGAILGGEVMLEEMGAAVGAEAQCPRSHRGVGRKHQQKVEMEL
ncbi:hypothetical protein [Leptolyngbya sp. PCC 6406]|uniref:hypothetical protein n=1 Tax=Leptolyngbya sp. PCC 6406 TaxID=1173264 RepID=UPI0002ABFAB3|nr:hypothetical protein [Leptolyngbya sp. PCC 6406]